MTFSKNFALVLLGASVMIAPASASTVYVTLTYTGTNQAYIVPADVNQITVYLWGAGGGSQGGAGGFSTGSLLVTPLETLTLVVGQGGTGSGLNQTIYGGGGAVSFGGGSGGGRSGIDRSGTQLIIAGGGGGGGGGAFLLGVGGGGGGLNGSDAGGSLAGGGGTQSAGGAGAANLGNSGGLLFGGSGFDGGGGGGGYYGGGAGGANSGVAGAAGGGSGYLSSFVLGGSMLVGSNGASAGASAPNAASALYIAGVGSGGATNTAGGNGLIVIGYDVVDVPEPAMFGLAAAGLALFTALRRYIAAALAPC